MANLSEVVEYLDSTLNVKEIPDYGGAFNGLQLENSGKVNHVAAAVDASESTINGAIEGGADLLVVHHGMFWHGVKMISGATYRKLKAAMDANLAIYSAHIPLDVHDTLGNNALLAESIGMTKTQPYGAWKGIALGLKQRLDCSLDELLERVCGAVGNMPHVCRGRDAEDVGVVGVVTGGAGSEIEQMALQGIDTFITGEGPHWSYPLAEELGVNLIYAGHYATETFGVKAVSGVICEKFALSYTFVDRPTGL